MFVVGYNDVGVQAGTATADVERIKKEVADAKSNSGVVVVGFHWGVEYTTSITARQKELAYAAIDSGADLILGNHPHWIQPSEVYNGKYIMYAHGNTIFDQMWSEKTKTGVIGKYIFSGMRLQNVEFIPTYIQDYGQPTLVNSLQAGIY